MSRHDDRPGAAADLLARVHEALELEPARTAALLVDMHRGHLDPAVATEPVPADWAAAVVERTRQLLATLRPLGVPVIHVVTVYRRLPGLGSESLHKAYARARREAARRLGLAEAEAGHNLEGSVQTEVMPALGPEPGDYVIDTKKSYSAFYGTDLEILLRALGVDTLLVLGVNTNTCVLNTTFDAVNRGYRAVVVSDCVAARGGRELHRFALDTIRRSLGWVLPAAEIEARLHRAAAAARRSTG
ncbi:MAG TPA: cysteine hydrolase [Thermodesulfobacteriota bacterium]|nr:cysteine hydrolase [Thermodesulfobacteriota bacterium]